MTKETDLLTKIKKIKSIAQIGLLYSSNEYDTERYNELSEISSSLIGIVANVDLSVIQNSIILEKDYITPKVDIRAVIFNEHDEILLVQERADGKWSLPGGWADIGYSPTEVAVKEVLEETGLKVSPIRLLAVIDKRCHPYPLALQYVYKFFIQCKIEEDRISSAFDILDVRYFKKGEIPLLSEERVIKEHVDLMFEYKNNPYKEVFID